MVKFLKQRMWKFMMNWRIRRKSRKAAIILSSLRASTSHSGTLVAIRRYKRKILLIQRQVERKKMETFS
jgi:hypothetical protein